MTRYSDGPSREVSIDIAADPGQVWALITNLELMPRFSPELLETGWVDGSDHVTKGARFWGRNHNPVVGDFTTTCTVLTCENGREWSWTPGEPDQPAVIWTYRIHPSTSGSTLVQRVQIGPVPGAFHERIIAPNPDRESEILDGRLDQLRQAMEANLAGYKALAEAG